MVGSTHWLLAQSVPDARTREASLAPFPVFRMPSVAAQMTAHFANSFRPDSLLVRPLNTTMRTAEGSP